jgi:hypothetical protein
MGVVSQMNLWSVAGLVFALAGVTLLSMALFTVPRPSARAETVPSHIALRRQTGQWLDQRIGAVLLVIGFFLQTTGALGTGTLNGAAALVLLGLAFGIAAYALLKDSIVEDLSAHASYDAAMPGAAFDGSAAAPVVEPEVSSAKLVNARRGANDLLQ